MSLSAESGFLEQIESAWQTLLRVREEDAHIPATENGWSPKEIVGHLIDSALNNHQRFVRAALEGSYEGPSYQQNDWVRIHGYSSMPWPTLLKHWSGQNDLLGEVVTRIPDERLETVCRIGQNAPVSLQFLVKDYLVHLHHHIEQIEKMTRESV